MTLTIDYLTTAFQQFNRDYFGGGLPLPVIKLSRAKTRLGSFSCKRKLTWKGYRMSDFVIRISTYYEMNERQVQNILLHEMIHYSIAYSRVKDTSAHGIVFRGMMDNLNSKYGWEISISENTRGWTPANAPKTKQRLVLALQTREGKCFLSVINPKCQQQIARRLSSLREIRWHEWYLSSDEYFSDFPVVRSLRGRRICPKQLIPLLKEKCKPLEKKVL